ncbi:hypothetical protein AL035_21770, partial [Salipiger aestuarii]
FCLSIQVLFKPPLRQMVASLLRFARLDWPAPDFSTLCPRQKTLAVRIPCRRADGPPHLSTGNKFPGDGEWQARKHGIQGRRHPIYATGSIFVHRPF